MIENKQQYYITKKQLELFLNNFNVFLRVYNKRKNEYIIFTAEKDGLESQILDLQNELSEYESKRKCLEEQIA